MLESEFTAMSESGAIANVDQIPPGRGLTVRIEGREIALFNVAGEICALDGQCPHRGGPLGEGFIEAGRVSCPMHGWTFDLKTGACADRPDRPATRLAVRVEGGQIFLSGPGEVPVEAGFSESG